MGKKLSVSVQKKYIDDKGVKHYEIGHFSFGSTTAFAEKFDVYNDPAEVIIDFREIADMSAIDALNKITERYAKLIKKYILRHLSTDCRQLLHNAEEVIEVIMEDPTYKVAVD
jgi:SulP family sulfate permease